LAIKPEGRIGTSSDFSASAESANIAPSAESFGLVCRARELVVCQAGHSAAKFGCACVSLVGKQRAESPAGSKCGSGALALAGLEDGEELAPSSLSGVREQKYIDPNQGNAINTSPIISLFDPLSIIRTKRFIVISCSSMNNRYSMPYCPTICAGSYHFDRSADYFGCAEGKLPFKAPLKMAGPNSR
jgi:hypothetical protein